jgi:transcription antitermination factor NusG
MAFKISDGAWIAVQVHPNKERCVVSSLKARHYDPFLPVYSERKCRSGKDVRIELPLFTGYIFCRWIAAPSHRIVDIPGVIRIVGGKQPIPLDDGEVSAIQRVTESGLYARPWQFLKTGEPVTIVDGPLCGLQGVVMRTGKHRHFIVSVTLLQRSVAVEVVAEHLTQLPGNRSDGAILT